MPPGRAPAPRPSRRALLLVLLLLLAACTGASRQLPVDPATDAEPLTFAEIGAGELLGGQFNIEGFVLQIFRCPDCPAGALCKPCDDDHLVIGPDPTSTSDGATGLRIYTPHAEHFAAGRRYRFTVRVRGDGVAELIAASRLD